MNYQAKPFDVEIFANSLWSKKNRVKKYRGPDSPMYTSLYPMIYIIKIFGLGPYGFVKDQLAVSNIWIIFSFVFFGIYTYNIYLVYMRFTGIKRDRPVLGWTETAKVAFNYFVAVHNLISAVTTRNTVLKVWNTLQDYDDTMKQLGYPRKETRTAVVAWTIFVIQTIIWTTVNRSGMYAFLESWTYNVGYMSIYVGSSVALYKFVGLVLLLGQRFHHLLEVALENRPLRATYKPFRNISKPTIQSLHNELLLASEDIGSIYSWSLFFWLANLSLHSVTNLYFVIDWILLTPWNQIAWPLILCLVSWLLSFLVQLLIVHIACDYTSSKANSMSVVLVDWNARLVRSDPKTTPVESLVHLYNRRLNFSAAGCFSVNFHLLRSIVALLTTYLVILLQLPN